MATKNELRNIKNVKSLEYENNDKKIYKMHLNC